MPPKNQRFWLTSDEVSTVIDAPAERLYDMVADMPRMGEWSPECTTVEWIDRPDGRRSFPRSQPHRTPRDHHVVAAGNGPRRRARS